MRKSAFFSLVAAFTTAWIYLPDRKGVEHRYPDQMREPSGLVQFPWLRDGRELKYDATRKGYYEYAFESREPTPPINTEGPGERPTERAGWYDSMTRGVTPPPFG